MADLYAILTNMQFSVLVYLLVPYSALDNDDTLRRMPRGLGDEI